MAASYAWTLLTARQPQHSLQRSWTTDYLFTPLFHGGEIHGSYGYRRCRGSRFRPAGPEQRTERTLTAADGLGSLWQRSPPGSRSTGVRGETGAARGGVPAGPATREGAAGAWEVPLFLGKSHDSSPFGAARSLEPWILRWTLAELRAGWDAPGPFAGKGVRTERERPGSCRGLREGWGAAAARRPDATWGKDSAVGGQSPPSLLCDKNGEMDHHREQYENLKWRLERKLEELDGELALQRQELLLEFESEAQKREHEFRLQADSMSSMVVSHELKVKLLNKELETLREAGAKATECLQRAEAANSELERKLQDQAWACRDLEAVKDAQIKDLEDKLHSVQLTRKKEEETFKRKHEELDRLARERDVVLAAVKGAHGEQLQALETRVLELQAHCESLEVQLRRAEWRQADAGKEKDAVIDRLREDASALKSAWDAQIAQVSKEMISRDLQVQALQQAEARLKAQLAAFQQDIDRYRQQLSLAVEREQSLQREQVQLGLDWQRRCDDVERDQIQKSEALIQGLTSARDQVAAKLQEAERALQEQEVALKAVTLERNQAVQALRTHGLPVPGAQTLLRQPGEETSKDFPCSEIQRLREQNASLRNAVAQMRRDMETLSEHILPSAQLGAETASAERPGPEAGGDTATPDYVLAFEAEVQNLKHKFKTLEEQLKDVLDPLRMSSSHSNARPSVHASEGTGEHSHLPGTAGGREAGCPGGSVRAGQAPTGLALRKLGDRVRLLNLLVTRLRQKVLQKPLELDTVQRELPREVDQVHLEVLELRTQVAELGVHLGMARQEGGEPSGRKQPRALDAAALQREGVETGAPAQAEDQRELLRHLRPGPQPLQSLSVHQLQRKLKEAARKILSLHLEKEQLIEMGNRLRAEGGHPKAQRPGVAPEVPLDRGLPVGESRPHFTTQGRVESSVETQGGQIGTSYGTDDGAQPQECQGAAPGQAEPGCPDPAEEAAPAKQHRITTVTCKSAHQKENRSPKPKPPQAQEFPEENGCHTQRSSSLASSSLQDTWKLLDLGSSPSGLTSQDDSSPGLPAPPAAPRLQEAVRSRNVSQAGFAIQGMKVSAQSKAEPTRTSKCHPEKARGGRRPPKIRNYNMKD
ncbi:PREDICTED: coiled-coil domain-containing protein 57 [Propithecus coquereli]|uniref:coiled-coil domain-containing protein 57 n=1 Tax=Propithecus coquereli TaxID=379532 RepID=UPI00063EE3AC|nr:PREDICTED: coiled-coil domain-containing protein 57 [Propithecus coquereli]